MKLVSNFKYFVALVAAILWLATGASANGNEVGDFGETPTGYPNRAEEKAAKPVPGISSIDLAGGQRAKLDASFIRIPLWYPAPKKPNTLFITAIHKQNTNDLTGAIADYQAAIKIGDNDPAVHWYLGTAYEAAGKANEAKQEFEKEQAMKKNKSLTINGRVQLRYSGGYGAGTGRGYGGGDFGSNTLKFVPGEGLTKPRSDGK